jgi:hypothetical protein
MMPSQPSRRVTHDRARRSPAGRPDYLQIHKVKASADAEPDAAAAAGPAPTDAGSAAGPKRNRAKRAFLIALIAVVAVNFGALLGLVGWGVLQALGLAGAPAIEAVQREQAASISQLDATVHALHAAVMGLSARANPAGDRDEATSRRMAEIDAALGVLRTGMNDMRAAQNAAAAEETWRKPMADLTASVTKVRSEIVGLRASLDEINRPRQPEAAAIGARIDRIEQAMVQHNLLGPIRGAIREPAVPARSPAAQEGAPAAGGHLINLAPDH